MDHIGAVVDASDFLSSNPSLIPTRGGYEVLFNVNLVNPMLENSRGGGETEGLRQKVLFRAS